MCVRGCVRGGGGGCVVHHCSDILTLVIHQRNLHNVHEEEGLEEVLVA